METGTRKELFYVPADDDYADLRTSRKLTLKKLLDRNEQTTNTYAKVECTLNKASGDLFAV